MKLDAAALGASPIGGDLRDSMSQLKETIREFSELNQLIADGVKDASNEEEANAFKAAGLNLVIGEAIKLVPGGYGWRPIGGVNLAGRRFLVGDPMRRL
jgi:hypothetical protein